MGKPYGFNLSYPSACHQKFDPTNTDCLRLRRCAFWFSLPFGSSSPSNFVTMSRFIFTRYDTFNELQRALKPLAAADPSISLEIICFKLSSVILQIFLCKPYVCNRRFNIQMKSQYCSVTSKTKLLLRTCNLSWSNKKWFPFHQLCLEGVP